MRRVLILPFPDLGLNMNNIFFLIYFPPVKSGLRGSTEGRRYFLTLNRFRTHFNPLHQLEQEQKHDGIYGEFYQI